MEVPLNWELSLSWTRFPMNLDIEPLTGTSEGNRLSRLQVPLQSAGSIFEKWTMWITTIQLGPVLQEIEVKRC
jgi:hypothetical protein